MNNLSKEKSKEYFYEEVKLPKYKSIITLGNINFYQTKKFNWFHKLTLRLIFGLKIRDYKEVKKDG